MTRSAINVTRLTGRLGRRPQNLDGIIGIVTNGVATANLDLGTVYVLNSLADLEALLVTPAYDTTNKVLVHHHVLRIYARNPSAEVHLMVLAKTVTMTQMCDKANNNAKKLSKDSNGRVKLIGIIRNPASDYVSVLDDGLDADVWAAIPKAQELKAEEAAAGRELSFFLEGREYNGSAASAGDLRAQSSPGVSVVIAADNDISLLESEYETYAAVGDVIGLASKAAVSQNIGELTGEFNLEDRARGFFLNPGLSNGELIKNTTDATLTTLDTKGYIFAETPASFSGVYINDTHVCDVISSDYFSIEANRTIDKMIRLVRIALLPRVKNRFLVDEETGALEATTKASLEDTANQALEVMVTDGDLSGGVETFIPDVNLLGGDPIEIEITAIPVAIGRQIVVRVGFNNPFNQ
jgi:hypothetical protein